MSGKRKQRAESEAGSGVALFRTSLLVKFAKPIFATAGIYMAEVINVKQKLQRISEK
jgi:hypothetical protein